MSIFYEGPPDERQEPEEDTGPWRPTKDHVALLMRVFAASSKLAADVYQSTGAMVPWYQHGAPTPNDPWTLGTAKELQKRELMSIGDSDEVERPYLLSLTARGVLAVQHFMFWDTLKSVQFDEGELTDRVEWSVRAGSVADVLQAMSGAALGADGHPPTLTTF